MFFTSARQSLLGVGPTTNELPLVQFISNWKYGKEHNYPTEVAKMGDSYYDPHLPIFAVSTN